MSSRGDIGNSLPQGWGWATVGELADLGQNSITDGPFGSNLKTEHYTHAGARVIRLQNIGDSVFRDEMSHISDEHYSRLRKHEIFAGDIVIAAFGDPAPRACIVPEIGPAIVKADCIRFKPTEHMVAPFLMYALNSPEVQHATTARIHGVGRPRINLTEIKEIVLPVAPKAEQKRVVAKIEALFTDLDAAVAALKRVQGNLKRYRAAVLKAACEGRLVPTEAELARKEGRGYETGEQLLARILKERRAKWEADQLAQMRASSKPPRNDDWKKKYKEPASPDTSNLPTLPEGWTWASIEQSAWDADYGTSERCDYTDQGLPVLRIPNITEGRISLDDLKFTTKTRQAEPFVSLNVGDLLIIRTNGSRDLIGRAALVRHDFDRPHLHASYLIRFRLLPELMAWIATVWNTANARGQIEQMAATSAGQYNVSVGKLNRLVVPIAPPAEQMRIVTEVERQVSEVAATGGIFDTNFARAERLRQSILKRAFEGKLVPQDPNDEPTSVLLERIRAERSMKTQPSKRVPQPRKTRVAAGEAV